MQEEFDCGDGRRFGRCLAWVIDAVTTDGNAAWVGFFVLRSDVGTESGIGDGAAGGDGIVGDEFDGVGAFDACFDSLGQASKFVGCGV